MTKKGATNRKSEDKPNAQEFLARRLHRTIVTVLRTEPICSKLIHSVPSGLPCLLLTKLLDSNRPVLASEVVAHDPRSESAVWPAAKKLNDYLADFCGEISTSKHPPLVIKIPLGAPGGRKFGYHFVCSEIGGQELIDAQQTEQFLHSLICEMTRGTNVKVMRDSRALLEQEPDLLIDASHVLKVESTDSAIWFRPTGAISRDLDAEHRKVYRRKEIDPLREKIMAEPFHILEGEAASGKTTIVRTLMYELLEQEVGDVLYFNISDHRGFDQAQLMRELRATESVCIIEDIHLEPHKIQWICQSLPTNQGRHILLTARPSYRSFQDYFMKDLSGIDTTHLEADDAIDGIVEAFCSDPETPGAVRERRAEIVEISGTNLWLLAFALRGCKKQQGLGSPKNWIANEVGRVLRNLETCGDECADQYPGILVALSPLQMNETVIAERYLVALGFTRLALNGLVQRGMIGRQSAQDGYIFYCLPHSTIATAYWEHGLEYRRLHNMVEHASCVYEYARLGVPNSLEALVRSPRAMRERVEDRLVSERTLGELLAADTSLTYLHPWCEGARSSVVMKDQVLRGLADNIQHCSLGFAHFVLLVKWLSSVKGIAGRLWGLLDRKRMRCGEIRSFLAAANLLESASTARREIYRIVDLNELAGELDLLDDPLAVCSQLAEFLKTDRGLGRTLWTYVDRDALAAKVLKRGNLSTCIECLIAADLQIATELYNNMDRSELTLRLSQPTSVCVEGIATVARVDKQFGRRLWQELDKSSLVEDLTKDLAYWLHALGLVRRLRVSNPKMAHALCSCLDTRKIASLLNELVGPRVIVESVYGVGRVSRSVAAEIWANMDRHRIAELVSRESDAWTFFALVYGISATDKDVAREFCQSMNWETVASNMNCSDDGLPVGQCLSLVLKVHKEAGQRLWKHVDKETLASKLCGHAHQWKGRLCVQSITPVDRDIAIGLSVLTSISEAECIAEHSEADLTRLRCYLERMGVDDKNPSMELRMIKRAFAG